MPVPCHLMVSANPWCSLIEKCVSACCMCSFQKAKMSASKDTGVGMHRIDNPILKGEILREKGIPGLKQACNSAGADSIRFQDLRMVLCDLMLWLTKLAGVAPLRLALSCSAL